MVFIFCDYPQNYPFNFSRALSCKDNTLLTAGATCGGEIDVAASLAGTTQFQQ
jgi:hypothetical protein